jgi:hypothetical protein
MSKFIIETGTAHGRGFSGLDVNGYLAKVLSWAKRPCVDGSTQTFTADAGTDVITCSSHGYVDGESVEVSSDTTLPSGLSASTEYYVIYVDADSFKLATRYAYAMAGTAINILDAGTGTHSVYAKGGGAGWYLRDDFSRCTDKTFATTDVNTSTEEITITAHGFAQDQIVRFTTTGSLPGGLSTNTNYYVIWIDANTIKLGTSYANSHAGSAINISSTGSGTHTITPYEYYIVLCDTASPAVNDYNTGPNGNAPKYLKLSYIVGEAGYVRMNAFLWWDSTLHRGEGAFSGFRIATYDDADFAYDFRGGEECLGLFARLGSTWTYCIIDEWTGIATLVEASTKVGILQSAASSGTSVVLQLDTGQAANFTADKYYYIYDFNAAVYPYSRCDYVKVTNVNLGSDQITVDQTYYSYNIGAVIAAYPHRYYVLGNNYLTGGTYAINQQYYDNVYRYYAAPYTSRYAAGYRPMALQGSYFTQSYYMSGWGDIYNTGDPDDEGYYYCMKPIVREYTNTEIYQGNIYISQNRVYGTANNLLVSAQSNMADMLDYRTLNSIDYLFIGTLASTPWLIRNTESTT